MMLGLALRQYHIHIDNFHGHLLASYAACGCRYCYDDQGMYSQCSFTDTLCWANMQTYADRYNDTSLAVSILALSAAEL